MKEAKYVEEPRLNEKVNEIIEELKKEIIHNFHPKSIIISGSFGKGEATVIEENGKLKFLSDCEVILIPYSWIFSRKKLYEFEQSFYKKTGLKVDIWGFTPTIHLCIPLLNKKMKPLIANYDLKYGSKVVYGKNYLERIPGFKSEDIPVWEGIRLLLNRMAEALEHFSMDGSDKMVFWCDKIILACQDALLLTIGKYTPSYRERNKIFIESIEQFDLSCIQTFAKLTIEATNRRLNQSAGMPIEAMKYWFQVSKICDEVLRYVLKVGYRIGFEDYLDFQEKYLRSPLQNYTTLPFNNSVLQNLFRFAKKIILGYKLPTLKMLLRLRTKWDHVLYSHIPLLYFGIRDGLEVNTEYLKLVISLLRILGCRVEIGNNAFDCWMKVKEIFVNYWRQLLL
jgi:hypothetical protein